MTKKLLLITLASVASFNLVQAVGCCFIEGVINKQTVIYKATVDSKEECDNYKLADYSPLGFVEYPTTAWYIKNCADLFNYSGWFKTKRGLGATPEVTLEQPKNIPAQSTSAEDKAKAAEKATDTIKIV